MKKMIKKGLTMTRVLFDIEADGFLENVTTIWCIVATDVDSGITRRYDPFSIESALIYLRSADVLIGHNIIAYDLPCIWKLYGEWDKVPRIADTFVMSCALWPERWGGHSLEAWGKHLGFPKGDFHEFEQYTKEMLEYCERDVKLNVKVLEKLEEEYGNTIEGYQVY